MAIANMKMDLSLVLLGMFFYGALAQSSNCNNVIISLSPCLNYITGNSSTPSSNCCSQLSSVVGSQPQCLCEVLNGGGSNMGISINQTQAMALPAACNVQTPSVTACNNASPADSPGSTPSGKKSDTVPSTDDGTSDGSSTKLSTSLLFLMLFAASYISSFIKH